jgi:hypothetical protein
MKPFLRHLVRWLGLILPIMIGTSHLGLPESFSHSAEARNDGVSSGGDEIFIYRIPPDQEGGTAYKLVYFVEAPIESYWKFKTDFDNDFLVENRYIRDHRFVSQKGNTVITENQYTNRPDVYFRWRTTIRPDARRLDFVLLNPEHCGQKYHYGYIQLEPVEGGTRVTQVAYFDFWGAGLWASFPWRGGMRHFLSYTANWEQQLMLRLKDRYQNGNPH